MIILLLLLLNSIFIFFFNILKIILYQFINKNNRKEKIKDKIIGIFFIIGFINSISIKKKLSIKKKIELFQNNVPKPINISLNK
jgi:hypothetical protein